MVLEEVIVTRLNIAADILRTNTRDTIVFKVLSKIPILHEIAFII